MEVLNTLAYYNTVSITAAKSFIVQAPVVEGWIQTHNLIFTTKFATGAGQNNDKLKPV
jgi:hypothetical protein